MWDTILTEVKKYTEPSGREYLDEIIESLHLFDKALSENDTQSLSSVYYTAAHLYGKTVPYIKNNSALAEAISYASTGCEEIAEKLKSNEADLKDVADFIKIAANKIISTLE